MEKREEYWERRTKMIFAVVGGGMVLVCGAFVWYILKR